MTHFVWNLDPVLLTLGPVTIRWYGLLFASALLLGLWLVPRMARHEGRLTESLDNLFVYIVVGTLVGARLYHTLVYEAAWYLAHPLEILVIWSGGLASHGGVIGCFIGVALFARRYPEWELLWLLDRVVPAAALGGALVRLGNFTNSEIVGRPTDLAWAVVFPRVDELPRHPVQLYEAGAYLLIGLALLLLWSRPALRARRGLLLGLFFIAVFGVRLLLEAVKSPQAAIEAQLPLSLGQLSSLPFIALGVWLVIRASRRGGAVEPEDGTAAAGNGARKAGEMGR